MSEPTKSKSKLNYESADRAARDQRDNNPNALIKARIDEASSYLKQMTPKLSQWITGGVDPRALVRFALLDLSAVGRAGDKLRECTNVSIYMALLACAVTGLEPGALKGEAFLVPFAKRAQFMPGWRGLIKQAKRSREVVGYTANVVMEGDFIDVDLGTANTLVHRPLLTGKRGPVIGAYAVAKMSGGHHEIEWMDIDDLQAVKRVATSRGGGDAWDNWEDQMFRKAPIRRLAKRLPLGNDYYVGLALERSHEDRLGDTNILDIMTDGEAARTSESAKISAEMSAQAGGEPDDEEKRIIAERERAEST
jgi:recombination protein RecT